MAKHKFALIGQNVFKWIYRVKEEKDKVGLLQPGTRGVQIRKKNFDFVYLFLDGTMQIRKLFTGFGKASLTINGFGNLQGD